MKLFLLFACFGFVACDFCTDSLPGHNSFRKDHHVPPLTCNPIISKVAQDFANQLAETCDFKHSGNPNYGENLYIAGSTVAAPAETTCAINSVKSWYSEVKCYDFANPGFNSCLKTPECQNCVVGHFTAVVWKNTTEIGVGVAKCKAKSDQYYKTIVVANYKEKGNFIGQFQDQVLKP